jgi:ribonuclease III
MRNTPIRTLQQRLGYRFRRPELLRQALTHSSASTENYERLEHLGDAVLDLAVTRWLYRDYPHFGPGQMSILRAEVVRAATLARLARHLALGDAIRLSQRADARGFRQRVTVLSDVFEALFGAVFVDTEDLDAVSAQLLPMVKPLVRILIDGRPEFYSAPDHAPEAQPGSGIVIAESALARSGG